MLRLLTENVCGELAPPNYEPGKGGVVYLCASNAVEWLPADGRFNRRWRTAWHGEFPMDHETWCDMMLNGFPAPTILRRAGRLPAQASSFSARDDRGAGRPLGVTWMAPPDDPARRNGPWPSNTHIALASAARGHRSRVPGNVPPRPALAGLVGDQALPFLENRETLNLPDPEDILKDPAGSCCPIVWIARTWRYSLAGAVLNRNTPGDGNSDDCPGVASRKNADIPAAARTLCDKRNRPEGLIKLPEVPAVLRSDEDGEAGSEE
jgi:hypothetical protein